MIAILDLKPPDVAPGSPYHVALGHHCKYLS
jgi:hypothetical protein